MCYLSGNLWPYLVNLVQQNYLWFSSSSQLIKVFVDVQVSKPCNDVSIILIE